jgi:hypothetical protein
MTCGRSEVVRLLLEDSPIPARRVQRSRMSFNETVASGRSGVDGEAFGAPGKK